MRSLRVNWPCAAALLLGLACESSTVPLGHGDEGEGGSRDGTGGVRTASASGNAAGAGARVGSGDSVSEAGTASAVDAGSATHSGGGTGRAGASNADSGAGIATGGTSPESETAGAPATLATGGVSTNPGTGGASEQDAGLATGGSAGSTTTTPAEPGEARSELARDTDPDIQAPVYAEFIDGVNQFGIDLFHAIAEDENVFYSPLSTAYALGMTYAGARENTAAEMRSALRITVSDDAFHAGFNRLSLDLASRNRAPEQTDDGEKSVELSLVDAAWAQTGYDFVPAYLDLLAQQYGAGVRLLDFGSAPEPSRAIINDWVSDQTQGRIVDLLPLGSITGDTRLVLTNALYFKATWLRPFEKNSTSDAAFTTLAGADVMVPTMHALQSVTYAAGSNYQIIDLPFFGDELAMSIVLPAEGSFHAVRDAMSTAWLSDAREAMQQTAVQVALPRFRFVWEVDLDDPLKSLGIQEAFTSGVADFTGITPPQVLHITDVLHKAFVGVDEDGTEAAAATAVVLSEWGVPDSVEFTVDRSFLVLVSDTTGALLFCGQVVDPSAE